MLIASIWSIDAYTNRVMFDSYGVLMLVPGAGLLGHFVHAPLKGAMHMLRELGVPSPLEGSERNGVPRPQLSRPAPRIAFPPAFREDPEGMRKAARTKHHITGSGANVKVGVLYDEESTRCTRNDCFLGYWRKTDVEVLFVLFFEDIALKLLNPQALLTIDAQP